MRLRLFLALIGLSVSLSAAPGGTHTPAYPPLDPKEIAALDRTWRKLEARDPNSGARAVYEFLLSAVAHNWHPEKWAAVIALGEELHDRDPGSPTYGNYRWYWREPKPNDRNAVEFSMQSASLTWVAYRDRLSPEARQALARELALGSEGMVRHKVDVSYTNIFLMRLANCILIGETTDRPDLVERGRGWLHEWLAYTRVNGIHEFSSPTYYGTDLTDLGALANFARTPEVRAAAEAALRLLWTDIAANWFTPYGGITGAHSRDYGFLTGHGYLDQQLLRAGWLTAASVSESHSTIDDLTFWLPPPDIRAITTETPRVVTQRWGAHPWERATHYVGRAFTLGSSGSGYGAQDKILALTLAGGPQLPIIAFALDYRDDPYGQSKMGTADGHAKLTHLLPFVASVQRGPEVLLVATYDPAHARNPAGGKQPITYAGIRANLVIPMAATLCSAQGPIPAQGTVPLQGAPLFLRHGETAAGILFVGTRNDAGKSADIAVVHDGDRVGAQRLTGTLAEGTPQRPVAAAIWIRATEGIKTDADFAAFQQAFVTSAKAARYREGDTLEVAVPGVGGTLRLVIDPKQERRLTVEGGEPTLDSGILVINGRNVGGPIMAPR